VIKNSKTCMSLLGAAALSVLLAPGASACGKGLAFKLSVLPPGQQTKALAAPANAGMTMLEDDAPAGSAVGLWTVDVSVGGQTIYQAFESFTGDGLEFLNDNGSPVEGSVCFGVWNKQSKNTVKVYHPAWSYDMNGNLIGTVIIREQFTFDPGNNSFKGTVVVDFYDLNGHVAAPELQAQLTGKRVTAS
jgi:hypothetical protein